MVSDDSPFAGRLLNGEHILWSARPRQGVALTPQDGFLIPFSLVWCGFAIFWESTVLSTNAPFFFRLWGIPFVLVGLYLVLGRFLVDAWLRSRMYYALTDRRVLIARAAPFANFTAIGLKQLPQADLSERPDGSGTIRFGSPPTVGLGRNQGWAVWSGPALSPLPQFFGISDVRTVFDLVQKAIARD